MGERVPIEETKYRPGFFAAICPMRSLAFESPTTLSIHIGLSFGVPEKISKIWASIGKYLCSPDPISFDACRTRLGCPNSELQIADHTLGFD